MVAPLRYEASAEQSPATARLNPTTGELLAGRWATNGGFAANLTVFDRALAPDRSLLETHVDLTIVDGAIAFRRQAAK